MLNQYAIEREQIALNSKLTAEQKQQAQLLLLEKNQYDIAELQGSALGTYQSLTAQLNGTSELDNLTNQKKAELEIIQKALDAQVINKKQAYATMASLDRKYYENVVSSLTNFTGELVGRQSKAYRVMFAIEKGFAIAQSVMAIQIAVAKAFATGITPIDRAINIASAISQGASIISNIQAVRQPHVGQAHDGIESVPREGTWLLDKNERVVKPRDNQKLTKFLDVQAKNGNKGTGNIEVTIINNTPANVSAFQEDGRLKVIISNEINKQVPAQLANPNSNVSKALKNNFGLMPSR